MIFISVLHGLNLIWHADEMFGPELIFLIPSTIIRKSTSSKFNFNSLRAP